jgi:hypothetical protein
MVVWIPELADQPLVPLSDAVRHEERAAIRRAAEDEGGLL